MMKRITSFLLATILLLGVVCLGTFDAHAESAMVASNECISLLKLEEGFSRTPYWDFTQYTVGYGTRCPSDMVEYYTQNGITEEEAEVLLRNHLAGVEHDLNVRIIDKYALTLTQNQFDALVLFSYNCGTSWAYDTSGTFHTAIASGATGNDLIRAFALWCSAGNQIRSYLLRRRLSEANIYLNNVYSQTPPENYCYVLYDANGGTTSPRSQGYDANLTAEPFPVPTYPGYTFQGWFTAKTGGTKVTVLDASTKEVTLYAQWTDGEGNTPPETGATTENPVTVTVTGIEVNLREGPGTNYTRVGSAVKGQQLVITETASGSGYTWGKFDGGWIALEYTDYETVINNQTPPETTTPPATEPPATQPEEPKLTGTVNVKEWLRIRSGPGTSYSVAGYLKPQQQIEILEQKTVGTQKWARIAEGWVSMDYIILNSNTSTDNGSGNTSATTWTGTVTADELLIRSGPGTNYSIVSYLKYGAAVTITEKKTNGSMEWGKIANGWISLSYVRLNTTNDSTGNNGGSGNNNATTETVTGTVNVNEWLRIRSGPGTSYSVAGYLKPNDRVTITQRQTAGGMVWGKIDSGWISLDYVILDNNTSDSTTQKDIRTVTADLLRVRQGPGTENTIVGYLYYGTKVEILEIATASNGGKWGRIDKGWIYLGYTK